MPSEKKPFESPASSLRPGLRTKVPKMSKELESDGAMVASLRVLAPMVLVPMRPRPSRQVRQIRSEDHASGRVTAALRLYVSWLSAVFVFVNLGVCGHDLIQAA